MKYKFNQKSLSFERYKKTAKQHIITIVWHAVTAIAFATIVLVIWNLFFDSPKEKQLKRKLEEYNTTISELENRVDLMLNVVQDFQEKDNALYRNILEANPSDTSKSYQELFAYANSKNMSDKEMLERLKVKTNILTLEAQKQLESYQELWQLSQKKEEIYRCIPAIAPVKNPVVVSGFGTRYHPIYKILRRHTGVDFIGKKGTPIYATADGTVAGNVQGMSGYGTMVLINHGNGYQTLYGHLSKKSVRAGQKVKRGEIIGYLGSTGLSSGTHLHYEVIKNGIKVDPIHYFFADLTPEEYNEILEKASEINQSMS